MIGLNGYRYNIKKQQKTQLIACVLFFIFRPDLMRVMMSIGNSTANSVWEANIKGRPKVLPSSSR